MCTLNTKELMSIMFIPPKFKFFIIVLRLTCFLQFVNFLYILFRNSLSFQFKGSCKVRNETETKQNETKQIETKRKKSKQNETDRNETKQIETKRNKTKRNKSKLNK